MDRQVYRIGIAGASSLAGKEVSDELGQSALADATVTLLDQEDVAGQLEATGDEATFIQRIDAASLEGLDFVIFAGNADLAVQHWPMVRHAGSAGIDMTSALEGDHGALIFAPWVEDVLASQGPAPRSLDLRTTLVVPAHPAAVMLALVAARLKSHLPLKSISATIFEPASQHGKEAMDELHQQTVNLLSFESLPKKQYDTQVAFNLLPAFGEGAAVYPLQATEDRIRKHFAAIAGKRLPEPAVQLGYAPVFHGYVASVLVELEETVQLQQVEQALSGEHLDLVLDESDPPSNLSSAGQEEILIRVRPDPPQALQSRRFWLWMAADNLKLASRNAIACVAEMRKFRPLGKVQ